MISIMISLAFVFILIVTGAWRKSYATVIYIVSLAVAMQIAPKNEYAACGVLTVGALVALIRAILNGREDSFFKGR